MRCVVRNQGMRWFGVSLPVRVDRARAPRAGLSSFKVSLVLSRSIVIHRKVAGEAFKPSKEANLLGVNDPVHRGVRRRYVQVLHRSQEARSVGELCDLPSDVLIFAEPAADE